MNNAEKFKQMFGFYATEMWAKSEQEFLDWINAEYVQENRWTPCSERLPKNGRYLVTGRIIRDWYESDKIVTSAFYDGEFWTDNGDIQAEAWMQLPEPYKGEES